MPRWLAAASIRSQLFSSTRMCLFRVLPMVFLAPSRRFPLSFRSIPISQVEQD